MSKETVTTISGYKCCRGGQRLWERVGDELFPLFSGGHNHLVNTAEKGDIIRLCGEGHFEVLQMAKDEHDHTYLKRLNEKEARLG